MLFFREPVKMQVLHPKHGSFLTEAYCILDAKVQAANHWRLTAQEEAECRVAVENAALEKAKAI